VLGVNDASGLFVHHLLTHPVAGLRVYLMIFSAREVAGKSSIGQVTSDKRE
jgi:hypothetical protein